jgi:ABC-type methionine transport system ATPase subunit
MKRFDPLDMGIVFYAVLIIGTITLLGCKTCQNNYNKQLQKEYQEQKQIKHEVKEMLDFIQINP